MIKLSKPLFVTGRRGRSARWIDEIRALDSAISKPVDSTKEWSDDNPAIRDVLCNVASTALNLRDWEGGGEFVSDIDTDSTAEMKKRATALTVSLRANMRETKGFRPIVRVAKDSIGLYLALGYVRG